jgi:hypothetical protein
LREAGFEVVRIKGSHHFLRHADGRGTVVPVLHRVAVARSILGVELPNAADRGSLRSLRRPIRTSGVRHDWSVEMDVDTDRIDEAVLALLHLGLHDGTRAWKSFDWDAMGRLHAKGYISDPVGRAKSVVFTEEGLRESERLFTKLFCRATT